MANIAIIPARGGSKRIPKKNIKDFFGKPLIAYSIQTALKSELFDKVVVSTDDEQIAKIAVEYGAEVLKRPKELADDFTGTGDVTAHALSVYTGYEFACTIYATAPMLDEKYLVEGLEKLQNSDAVHAFSATSMPFPIQRTFKLKDERCEMFTPEHYMSRSQDLEEAYQDAGQFYWKKVGVESDEIMFGKDSIPVILPRYLVQDIDTLEDWNRAELMYKVLQRDRFVTPSSEEEGERLVSNFTEHCSINVDNDDEEFIKKILFRADSSSQIGLGHIMRDLVLAKQFKDDEVMFACQDLSGNIMDKIPYTIKILHTSKVDELIEVIIEESIDMLVIDNYDISYDDEKKIKEETGVKIFVLDDTYERHYCDVLLNHNISADESKYDELVSKGCELQCGSDYTLIRDEFVKAKRQKRVFIAMGGSDASKVNIKVLKVLKKFKYFKVDIVTTSANANLKDLKKYVKNRSWVKLHIDTDKIAKLMKKCDFAIVTPSVTVNEVYYMQVPFIAIKTANNQEDIYEYLAKENFSVLEKFHKKNLQYAIKMMLKEKQCY